MILMENNPTKLKKKTISKLATVGFIAENLEKLYPKGIPKEQFILQMIESGLFSKMEAEIYFDKLHRSGFMHEPKLGFFKIDW